jgi:hypothetical protein
MQVFLGYFLDNLNQQQNQNSYFSNNNSPFVFLDAMNALLGMASNFAEQIPQFQQTQSFQGQPPASKLAMESLKIVSLKSRLVKQQPTCSICMEDFNDTPDQTIRAMPCGHVYHQDCIFAWLKKSNTCCNCRYEIETDNHDYNVAMKKRMANLHPAFTEHECALAPQGACDYEDENGVYYEDVEACESKHILQASCGCSYHDSCLRSSLIIRGYVLQEEGGKVTFRCSKCHKDVEVTLPPLNKIYEECDKSKGKKEGDSIENEKPKDEAKTETVTKSEEMNKPDETPQPSAPSVEDIISDNPPASSTNSTANTTNTTTNTTTTEKCALISQDLCDFEGQDGRIYGDPSIPKPMVKANCGCIFHNACLKSALAVRNYNLENKENKPMYIKCPKCNNYAIVTLLP